MFERYATGRFSLKEIARWAQDEGLVFRKTKRCRKFSTGGGPNWGLPSWIVAKLLPRVAARGRAGDGSACRPETYFCPSLMQIPPVKSN